MLLINKLIIITVFTDDDMKAAASIVNGLQIFETLCPAILDPAIKEKVWTSCTLFIYYSLNSSSLYFLPSSLVLCLLLRPLDTWELDVQLL